MKKVKWRRNKKVKEREKKTTGNQAQERKRWKKGKQDILGRGDMGIERDEKSNRTKRNKKKSKRKGKRRQKQDYNLKKKH